MLWIKKSEKREIKKVDERDFEKTKDMISKENQLIRCPNSDCGKLLSKWSDEGMTLQHRGLIAIIIEGKVQIKCAECGQVIEVNNK